MKHSLFLFIVLLWAACSNSVDDKKILPQEQGQATVTGAVSSTVSHHDSTAKTDAENRFLNLAKSLDSAGYSFDTARFRKTYPAPPYVKAVRKEIAGFHFYSINFRQTINPKSYSFADTSRSARMFAERFVEPVETVTSITAFYFVRPNAIVMDGEENYPDGVIEQWSFPDTMAVKKAARVLTTKLGMPYLSDYFLPCSVGSDLYLFHTRSIYYSEELRVIFNRFAEEHHARKGWYEMVKPRGEL